MAKQPAKMQRKVHTVLHEFKHGSLHSGKGGKLVKSRSQAIAIALSAGRKAAGMKPRRPKKGK